MAKHLRNFIIILLGVITLGACSSAAVTAPPFSGDIEFQGAVASAAERQSCTAAGGTISRQGLAGYEMCVLPYADAGKVCSDSSECLGQCRAQTLNTAQQSEAAQNVTGQCQANNIPFGCHSEIIGGTIQPGLCVD